MNGLSIDVPGDLIFRPEPLAHQQAVLDMPVDAEVSKLVSHGACEPVRAPSSDGGPDLDDPKPVVAHLGPFALAGKVMNFNARFAFALHEVRTPTDRGLAPGIAGASDSDLQTFGQVGADLDRARGRGAASDQHEKTWQVPFREFHSPIIIPASELVKCPAR